MCPRQHVLALALSSLLLGVSCHKSSSSSTTDDSDPPAGPALDTIGSALFFDLNHNGLSDEGDAIQIPFNVQLRINDPSTDSLELPIRPDYFGAGSSLSIGYKPNVLRINVGKNAWLRSRGADLAAAYNHRSTRIEAALDIPADAIENSETGRDLESFSPVDLMPLPSPSERSG